MLQLKSFLVNCMVGSEDAFNALLTLRATQDAISELTPQNQQPLTDLEKQVLDFYREGWEMGRKTQQQNLVEPVEPTSEAPNIHTATTQEPVANTTEIQEKIPENTPRQEDQLPQQIETIINRINLTGITRIGAEIILADEELQQMETLTQETKQLLAQHTPLQDLLTTIRECLRTDKGFSIKKFFGGGIVENPNIDHIKVIPPSNDQSTQIEVPSLLYELYVADHNAGTVLSLINEYKAIVDKRNFGKLGSHLAGYLEKTLAGYRQLKPQPTA